VQQLSTSPSAERRKVLITCTVLEAEVFNNSIESSSVLHRYSSQPILNGSDFHIAKKSCMSHWIGSTCLIGCNGSEYNMQQSSRYQRRIPNLFHNRNCETTELDFYFVMVFSGRGHSYRKTNSSAAIGQRIGDGDK
jgi:hypothetical protein